MKVRAAFAARKLVLVTGFSDPDRSLERALYIQGRALAALATARSGKYSEDRSQQMAGFFAKFCSYDGLFRYQSGPLSSGKHRRFCGFAGLH